MPQEVVMGKWDTLLKAVEECIEQFDNRYAADPHPSSQHSLFHLF
jgi:hypothetical protein